MNNGNNDDLLLLLLLLLEYYVLEAQVPPMSPSTHIEKLDDGPWHLLSTSVR